MISRIFQGRHDLLQPAQHPFRFKLVPSGPSWYLQRYGDPMESPVDCPGQSGVVQVATGPSGQGGGEKGRERNHIELHQCVISLRPQVGV